jgi:hypothetical protein
MHVPARLRSCSNVLPWFNSGAADADLPLRQVRAKLRAMKFSTVIDRDEDGV